MATLFSDPQNRTSGTEQLIGGEDEISDGVYNSSTTTTPICAATANRGCGDLAPSGMRFSTLSECSSYYHIPNATNEDQHRYVYHKPYLRANVRIIIGSTLLTIVGITLICLGIYATFITDDFDIDAGGGWIIIVVGILFFVPGGYHSFYIICALLNRPGYKFQNLGTLTHPPPM